jgi:hypothetical protein
MNVPHFTVHATCQTPAITIALHVLRFLFVPSVAYDVVENRFARGFESYLRSRARWRREDTEAIELTPLKLSRRSANLRLHASMFAWTRT